MLVKFMRFDGVGNTEHHATTTVVDDVLECDILKVLNHGTGGERWHFIASLVMRDGTFRKYPVEGSVYKLSDQGKTISAFSPLYPPEQLTDAVRVD
jgi:hypothetical protein